MKNNFAPRSKFETWVRNNGGTLVIAKKLNKDQSTVQKWCGGRARPSLENINDLLKLAKGHLTFQDIVRGTKCKA